MRNNLWISSLMMLSACGGCTGMNNTEQGAVSGGVIGGALGAIVGGRHPLAAAAIGAGAGTLVGAAVGSDRDRYEDRRTAQTIAAVNAQAARQMTLDEIAQLSQRGTPDDIIMQQISSTGSVWPNFSTADITYLQDQRVSSRVISYIQQSRRYLVVQPRPYYAYPPPPPVGVGVVISR